MLIRPERAADVAAIRAVTAAAFAAAEHAAPPVEADGVPGEATLVGWLRADVGWEPRLSLVAEDEGEIIGHVVGTRGRLQDRPALGLGPLSVVPARQGQGIGSVLVHSVLAAADALGEPVAVLLGDPGFYARFGFVPASSMGIEPPDPAWGDYFQARPLAAYDESWRGRYTYAAPFDRL
ncbi:GNAT family N-acetyltransferase [Nocardioides insulae]|uniref:GNAT family N-acetyltransferase n=1 Tax=Nocardioides insulae TaxID=394734 RepID=UPI00048C1F42|nr:N-acetyltransferase [Nocardioides insulae]